MYLDIFKVAQEKNVPFIYTMHDFYSICPSVKLFDVGNIYFVIITTKMDVVHAYQKSLN